MTPLAWLLLGDEIYGLRQAIRNLLLGLRPLVGNDAIRLIALSDGPFVEELRHDGFTATVLDIPAAPLAELRARFDPLRATTDAFWNTTFITRALAKELRRDTPRLLNIAWPALLAPSCLAAARTKTRVAFHEMNNVGDYPLHFNTRVFGALLKRCDGFALPCSQFIADALGPSVRSAVLPLAANTDAFTPPTAARRAAARGALGLAADAFVVGVVARLDPPKGQHLLIDALAQLPDVHAVIAGGDLDGGYGRELVARAAGNARITFTGPVAAPETIYDALDVVLNTRVDPEPLGLSVIEAILMELPVVAHDLGGVAETLRLTHGGVALPHLDATSLATAIAQLRDGSVGLDMTTASNKAAERFSIPSVANRYLACTSEFGLSL